MSLTQVLVYSLIVTGRITVLLVFSALALGVLWHLFRVEGTRRAATHRDRRSWPGAIATFVLGALVPVCVKMNWGAVGKYLPQPVAAPLAALGTLMCFVALTLLVWSVLVLGHAGHVLARVDWGGKLIREPPFNMVRHPIYFGLGLLFAGSALAALSWPAAVVAVAWWPVAAYRARIEDELLRKAFGREFEDYRRAVPGIWPR
ncbi:MAG: isoprenylcysteine carboxylmethyltransferase family protein [Candidatus Eisenbacteria bacterium]|nr:isoprenylcysteine carboxylmethyltransferase family protein [Candidatus Eisenbacteria bacterium]